LVNCIDIDECATSLGFTGKIKHGSIDMDLGRKRLFESCSSSHQHLFTQARQSPHTVANLLIHRCQINWLFYFNIRLVEITGSNLILLHKLWSRLQSPIIKSLRLTWRTWIFIVMRMLICPSKNHIKKITSPFNHSSYNHNY
jgi:hypothetical protein